MTNLALCTLLIFTRWRYQLFLASFRPGISKPRSLPHGEELPPSEYNGMIPQPCQSILKASHYDNCNDDRYPVMLQPEGENCTVVNSLSLNSIPACDRQTDGQMHTPPTAKIHYA